MRRRHVAIRNLTEYPGYSPICFLRQRGCPSDLYPEINLVRQSECEGDRRFRVDLGGWQRRGCLQPAVRAVCGVATNAHHQGLWGRSPLSSLLRRDDYDDDCDGSPKIGKISPQARESGEMSADTWAVSRCAGVSP